MEKRPFLVIMNKLMLRNTGFHKILTALIILFACMLSVPRPIAGATINMSVTVLGIDDDLKKNVIAYLSIERQKNHPDLTLSLIKQLHKKAPEEIRRALQPFGYYHPEIQADLLQENSEWHAIYKIDSGRPVIIEDIDLSIKGAGAEDDRIKELGQKLPLKKGDVLNHERFEEAKQKLHDRAVRFGYLKAEMISGRVDVYPENNSASVTLHFDTGPQYHFGDVEFIQDTFDPEFLSRLIPFRRGDSYSLSQLILLQNSLYDSDLFDSVEVILLTDKLEGLEVPIQVKLIPRKRHKYTFGLGFGTDTGFRGSLGWEDRRVNKSGHRFKTGLRISDIRSSITAEYLMPIKNPRTDSLVLKSGWLKEDTETSESEKFFSEIRYIHMRNNWKETIYTNYEQETFEIGEDSGQSSLVIPGISWTRISADNLLTSRQGSRIFLDISGAHEAVLSDTSFLQLRTQIKHIQGLTSLSRLIIRGEGGATLVDKFDELPPSIRFFTGGDNSIRGYAYDSLGPENEEGTVIGGRYLMVGSIEFEHSIINKWSAAVFYDVGNAVDDFSDSLKQGAGFGLRWASPVGPFRLDLAFPLDKADKSWRLHFNIGPDL